MSIVKVTLPGGEIPVNGKQVSFVAPCDCDAVNGLSIEGETYTVCDAMGNCVTGIGGFFCAGAVVSVILNTDEKKAFIQNPATKRVSDEVSGLYGFNGAASSEDVFKKLSASVLANTTQVIKKAAGLEWQAGEGQLPVSVKWRSICSGGGKIVAVGQNGETAVSTDGVSWTQGDTLQVTNGLWSQVCCGNGTFVAVASSDSVSRTAYSEDGLSWNEVTLANSKGNWNSVAFGNGVFVAVSGSEQTCLVSSDGKTWTRSNDAGLAFGYYVSFCNGMFVTTANVNGVVLRSTDGVTWDAQRNTNMQNTNWVDVIYAFGKYIMLGTTGHLGVSTDAITWSKNSYLDGNGNWNSLCYANGILVACSTTGNFAYSYDGTTWQYANFPAGLTARDVALFNNDFVAVLEGVSNGFAVSKTEFENRSVLTDALGNLIGIPVDQIVGGVKIETGSYVGTGTYGASNPTVLTFNSEPLFVIIVDERNGVLQPSNQNNYFYTSRRMSVVFNGMTQENVFSISGTYYRRYYTWGDNFISWYSSDGVEYQLNESNIKYYYFAIRK